MLDTKTYSRQELIELFGTDRIDSIKSKIQRQGYTYTTSGRGDGFTLTITRLPQMFRQFCINELGFAPQSDFKRIKYFLCRLFFDEEFQKMPPTIMEHILGKEGVYVSYQTITRWIQKLIDGGLIWRSFADFNYYTTSSVRDKVVEFIDKETYCNAWKTYWENRETGYNYSLCSMVNQVKGTPHKVGKIIENAFEADKLERLLEILEREKDEDD